MNDRPGQTGGADWTRGAASWAASITLGIAAGLGLWASFDRHPAGPYAPPRPAHVGPPAIDAAGAPAAPTRPPSSSNAVPTGTAPDDPFAMRIDVNAADAAALDLLPRIGPALARRIIDSREADGPFASLDDLQRVRGIGPKTVEGLREFAAASTPEPPDERPADADQ